MRDRRFMSFMRVSDSRIMGKSLGSTSKEHNRNRRISSGPPAHILMERLGVQSTQLMRGAYVDLLAQGASNPSTQSGPGLGQERPGEIACGEKRMSDSVSYGGCQCGSIRFELSRSALELYVCHCKECRKQAASAFGISVIVPRAAFRLTQGTPKFWSRATHAGHTLDFSLAAAVSIRAKVPPTRARSSTTPTLSFCGGMTTMNCSLRSSVRSDFGSAFAGGKPGPRHLASRSARRTTTFQSKPGRTMRRSSRRVLT